jgi:choice-of-anchor B domain-containing protein
MKTLTYLFTFSILYSAALAQLPNHNAYLISQLNEHPGYSGLWGYIAPDGKEYALLGCTNGTSFVDITDSSNVYEVDFIPGLNNIYREVKAYSHYAYIVSEANNSRLQIVDLQYLPDSVSLVSTFTYPGFTRAHAISQSENYLYLSGGNVSPNGGMQILDVTNPVLPVVRGFNAVRYVHDCRILNDTVWAANILNQRVSIIDANDKDNPFEIRTFNSLEPMPHNIAITSDRRFLFLTHENQNPAGKLEIWNIEDLEDITFVGTWQPTGISTSVIHNIEIYGDSAYIAHYTAGIRILNIVDPANPVEVAWYDTQPLTNSNAYDGCWAVYKFPSGKIIGSDISNGLFVIKTTAPSGFTSDVMQPVSFSLLQNYPNPFNPVTVIRYSLSEKATTSLKVYDIQGRTISVLADEVQSAGTYETQWNAEGFASGIYFYELHTGDRKISKRMLLLK